MFNTPIRNLALLAALVTPFAALAQGGLAKAEGVVACSVDVIPLQGAA